MRMTRWFILLMIFISGLGYGQARPKIGLALSGGGAKSMTHIGVIRVLEEHNIRPDYITGTSMGAIIGAMYSMGYSADQIEQMLMSVDWDALLNNMLPRYRLSYLDRRSDDRYAVTFDVDTNGIKLPDAINAGQYVLSTLAHLLQGVHADSNFSEYPIPFSCIATNLETGEMTVFDQGDLAHVLRASSAFPSIFSPFEIDGQLYVDGGIRNNLPISLLKEKGMDIVIASDAQASLHTRENLTDMISILEQVGSYPNMEYFSEQLKDADLIIHPPLEPFNIVSYEYTDSIIRLGEEETRKYSAQLEKWGSAEPLPERHILTPSEKVLIRDVQIFGTINTTDRFILSNLNVDQDDSTDTKEIRAGMERLYGSRFYEQVDYRFIPTDSTGVVLKINVVETKENQQIRLGVHYDDDYKMGVLLNLTVRNALMKNSKFSFDVVLGENPRGELSYIFERGFIPALGFRADFHQFDTRVYQEGQPVSEFTYTDFSSELFLHSTLWDLYTIGGGVRLENIDISEPILRSEIEESNNTYLNYFAFVDFDSFNRTYKPTSGIRLFGEFKIISEQTSFESYLEPVSILHLQYDQTYDFGEKWGGRTRILGATTIGPDAPFPYSIFLGGMGENYTQHIFPFVGYRYMELFGRNALTLRADVWYEAFEDHFFTLHANVGKLEATIDDLYSSDVLLDGYGISYGYNSALGPLEIFLMKSTNHSDLLAYVRLGFWF